MERQFLFPLVFMLKILVSNRDWVSFFNHVEMFEIDS